MCVYVCMMHTCLLEWSWPHLFLFSFHRNSQWRKASISRKWCRRTTQESVQISSIIILSIVVLFPDCFSLVWEWNCITEGQTHCTFFLVRGWGLGMRYLYSGIPEFYEQVVKCLPCSQAFPLSSFWLLAVCCILQASKTGWWEGLGTRLAKRLECC